MVALQLAAEIQSSLFACIVRLCYISFCLVRLVVSAGGLSCSTKNTRIHTHRVKYLFIRVFIIRQPYPSLDKTTTQGGINHNQGLSIEASVIDP